MNTVLYNSGFGIKTGQNGSDEAPQFHFQQKTTAYHPGFIISATNSMVNDHPVSPEIEKDILNKRISDKQHMLPFINYIIHLYLQSNGARIKEYFERTGKKPTGWKVELAKFRITVSHKTGVLFKDEQIVSVNLLNLADSHPVQFSRDFTGYFFEFSTTGKILFTSGKQVIETTKFSLSKIPILAFKSNNSMINEKSRKISEEILFRLLKKKLAVHFI